MIGSLLEFSCDKRSMFFPNSPLYDEFDGRVGLVTSNNRTPKGEYVRVQWVKPFVRTAKGKPIGGLVKYSDFNILNFIVVGGV